jgi:hypothetical protein
MAGLGTTTASDRNGEDSGTPETRCAILPRSLSTWFERMMFNISLLVGQARSLAFEGTMSSGPIISCVAVANHQESQSRI